MSEDQPISVGGFGKVEKSADMGYDAVAGKFANGGVGQENILIRRSLNDDEW